MNPLSNDIAWTLIHFLWQGVLVAVMAKVLMVALRRRSANLRYAVALFALLAMVGSVVGTFLHLRGTALPFPQATLGETVASEARSGEFAPDAEGVLEVALSQKTSAESVARVPVGQLNWKRGVAITWLGGVALLSLWRMIGLLGIARLRRCSEPVSPALAAEFETLRKAMRAGRYVVVRLSSIARVPMVVGIFRPMVLVPTAALAGLSPEQLRAILAHELAHVRRHDYLANLLQTAVETLLFFHPCVWWLGAVIRREREHCCDDVAVRECADASELVGALGQLAQLSAMGKTAPGLAMAARGEGEIVRRVARLLETPKIERRGSSWAPALLLLVVLMITPGVFRQTVAAAPGDEVEAETAITRGKIVDRHGRVLAETREDGLRHYPFGAVAAHLLGRLKRTDPGDGEIVSGRDGVEKSGNETLKAGNDLRLTIDLSLQFAVETALREKGIGRGAVVVIDPNNGDVVAMASVPSYDPNVFEPSISMENWELISEDPSRPLLNRCLQKQYPPSSVFKTIAALTVDDADQVHQCSGSLMLDGRQYKCWKRGGHGELDLAEAVKVLAIVTFTKPESKPGWIASTTWQRALGSAQRPASNSIGKGRGIFPTRK